MYLKKSLIKLEWWTIDCCRAWRLEQLVLVVPVFAELWYQLSSDEA